MQGRRPRRSQAWRTLACSALLCALQACTSVQWLDSQGHPQAIGLASSQPLRSDPMVTRIVAPGISLRLVPGLVGYSIGWRETVLFQIGPQSNRATIAFADRCYGVALDLGRVMFGAEHRFAVFQPEGGESFVQQIDYSESGFIPTRVERREVR